VNYFSDSIFVRSTEIAPILSSAVRAITSPVITGISEVSVVWYVYRDASLIGRSISTFAFPSIAGRAVSEIRILRNCNGRACVGCLSIPTITFPASAVGRVLKISVRRHFDWGASLAEPLMPTIASPPITCGLEIRVWWNRNRDAGAIYQLMPEIALPSRSVG
jgi:hypothetical protein